MIVEDDVQIARKLELLKLADELGSVSAACRRLGVSRDTFYRARQAYADGGLSALKNISRKKPNIKNRVSSETEAAVLELSTRRPSYGQARIASELAKLGIRISPAGVRCVWQRHAMQTYAQRRELAAQKTTATCRNAKAAEGLDDVTAPLASTIEKLR